MDQRTVTKKKAGNQVDLSQMVYGKVPPQNIEIEKATLPFYKSSKDISTEHLGLGLNISKILSERHGGNIQIANNKAGGACVTVKINCNES